MIGKQSGQEELASQGIEHKPEMPYRMNKSLRWLRFDALQHKVFNASREGQRSYPPLVLFKVLLLQKWYGPSNTAAEEGIGDRQSFRRFPDLLPSGAVPDATITLCFRGRLPEEMEEERLLAELIRLLDVKGLLVKRGSPGRVFLVFFRCFVATSPKNAMKSVG